MDEQVVNRARQVDIVELVQQHGISLKKQGAEFLGLCPFHDDTSPSLSVNREKGKYYCFACTAHGDAIDFVMQRAGCDFRRAVGLINGSPVSASSRPAHPASTSATENEWEPVHLTTGGAPSPPLQFFDAGKHVDIQVCYPYRNAEGVPLHLVCRADPADGRKIIRPLMLMRNRRTGEMRWNFQAPPEPRPLYGLELLAIYTDSKVVVVEGEKAADAFQRWVAMLYLRRPTMPVVVTYLGGANAIAKTDWGALRGREVVVWGDADKPGQLAADLLCSRLLDVAAKVKRLNPPEGAADGWDAADAVADPAFDLQAFTKTAKAVVTEAHAEAQEELQVGAATSSGSTAVPTEPFVAPEVIDPPVGTAERPVVLVREGERARMVEEVGAALAAHEPYFRRGEAVVRVLTIMETEKTAHGLMRARGSVVLKEARPPVVVADLSRCADVLKYNKKADEWVPCDLPDKVAASFCLMAAENNALSPIVGITHCPVMQEDGALLTTAGYDPASSMYLVPSADWSLLQVPERPTMQAAQDALKWLLSTAYRDFPFADDASKAVAISSLLTAVVRPAIDCAPVHAFSAPQYGAGKSLQASFAAIIATGAHPAMLAPGHNQEEFEKRVDSAIIEGDPVVVIDNISRPLAGDNLCAAITGPVATIRKFGTTSNTKVRTSAFWMVTGQNMEVRKDMHRRTVICYIDPAVERPETREGFAVGNLTQWAKDNRVQVLSAVYTMLRAHAQAGFPACGHPLLGNLEQWSKRVAHCLVWLGLSNPVASQQRLRDDDPEVAHRALLFKAIHGWQLARTTATAATGFLVKDLRAALESVMHPNEVLRSAVAQAVSAGVNGLPAWLRTHKNQMVTIGDEGPEFKLRLVQIGTAGGGGHRWSIERKTA